MLNIEGVAAAWPVGQVRRGLCIAVSLLLAVEAPAGEVPGARTSAVDASLPGASRPAEPRRQLLAELEELRVRNDVAAFGLVIVQGDRITTLATRGLADRASGRPITDKALFRVGSISKMFTGLLAADMAAHGIVDLDAPIHTLPLLDTYSNPWRERHPVTAARLLEHSAGFTDLAKPEWDHSDPAQPPLAETLSLHPEARVTRWPPGLHSSYSNGGFGLAGRVLELCGEASYEELLQRRVLGPIGLDDTSALRPRGNRLASGYDRDGVSPIPYWHQIFRPFAGINTTLSDMGRFLRLFINRGELDGRRLYPEAVIERVEVPSTTLAARAGMSFGYGLGNYHWQRDGITFHGHGGDADGYLSRLGYSRANGSGYLLVITAFQNRTLNRMRALVERHLIAGLPRPEPPPTPGLDPILLRTLLGGYRAETWRFAGARSAAQSLELVWRDGGLYSQHDGGEARRLLPVSDTLFRRPWQTRATVFIGPGDDGRIYYQGDEGNFVSTPAASVP